MSVRSVVSLIGLLLMKIKLNSALMTGTHRLRRIHLHLMGHAALNSQYSKYVNSGSSDQLATRGEGSIPSPGSSDQGDGIQMTLPVDILRLIESYQLTQVKSGRVQGAVQVLPFAARWNATITKSISFCKGVDTLKYEMETGNDFRRGKPKSHDNSGKIDYRNY